MANPQALAIRRMARLTELLRLLNQAHDLETFLQAVIKTACELLPCEDTLILLYEAETDTLKFVACPPEHKEALKPLRMPLERSLTGQVYRWGRPYILQNAQGDSRLYPELDVALESAARSLVAVPLVFHNQVVGVMEARNKILPAPSSVAFTADDLGFLESLASLVALTCLGDLLLEEVKVANAQVEALEKMKSDFIAITSHELRTPIGLILGHTTYISEMIQDKTLKQQMQVVLRNTARLKQIIENITKVNEFDTGASRLKRNKVSLNQLVQSVVAAYQARANAKQVKISGSLPDADVRIEADEEKIAVALNNLVHNAISFTDPGGSVAISVEQLPGYVQISVQDSGVGIPSADLAKVFDRFFQVQSHLTRKHGGMGLGLSVAKAMIELHKGQIYVESKEGQGSKFTFVLPTQAGADQL
jgi:signal transduction histidine kinase